MPTTKVVVTLKDGTSYDVRIGTGLLDGLGARMREVPALVRASRAAVVTDTNVAPLYMKQVKASLAAAGFAAAEITLPAGETTKAPEVVAELWQAFAQLRLTRDDCVVVLGGGVVGDTAGFAAATYMRGIPVVQVPTTLIAAVDASVGGKTAVNLPQGKNLAGAFWQPAYVCCDVNTLATLPAEEWTSGLAEVAKTALLTDDESVFWLLEQAGDLSAPACVSAEPALAVEMIARAVVAKADIVGQDPTDTLGLRAGLNYGHTLGHAWEAAAGFGNVSHGRAVAQGMRVAGLLSAELAGLDPDVLDAQNSLLDALGLPAEADLGASPEDLVRVMASDKKNSAGTLCFVLLRDVGKYFTAPVEPAAVAAAIEMVCEEAAEGGAR